MKIQSSVFRRLNSRLSASLGPGESFGGSAPSSILKTMFNKESTTVTYTNSKEGKPTTVSFSNLFLRDSSGSRKSVDPSSGQKLFTTGQLVLNPASTIPQRVDISEDKKGLHIEWGDGDKYLYPLAFLNRYSGHSSDLKSSPYTPVLWDQALLKQNIKSLLSTSYDSFMDPHSDRALYRTLVNMRKFGISFITDFPDHQTSSESLVKKVAERIGPIRRTFYGETFDVVNKPDAENIAYTNVALPLHQDLLYLDSTPGWQILHAIKNPPGEGEAGMSYFSDAFNAARYVHDTHADAYEALTQVPINYCYQRDDKRYYNSRPLVVENEATAENLALSSFASRIKEISYSPMFQAPFDFGIWEKPKGHDISTPSGKMTQRLIFKEFLRGLAQFEKFVKMPQNQFRLKLPENTCVIFDNRRILHGRAAFSGERWLQGCYLDDDAVKSRLLHLIETGDESLTKN